MARSSSLLDETLQGWTYAREGVIAELANIPAAKFTFKPAPESRTVAELARHIIESDLLAAGELTRPDGNFQRKPYPELLREHAGNRANVKGKDGLIERLRTTHKSSLEKLRAAGETTLLRPITQFNGEPAARLIWLHHAIAHEEYHRGQLALYARLLGLVPALTQLIHGES